MVPIRSSNCVACDPFSRYASGRHGVVCGSDPAVSFHKIRRDRLAAHTAPVQQARDAEHGPVQIPLGEVHDATAFRCVHTYSSPGGAPQGCWVAGCPPTCGSGVRTDTTSTARSRPRRRPVRRCRTACCCCPDTARRQDVGRRRGRRTGRPGSCRQPRGLEPAIQRAGVGMQDGDLPSPVVALDRVGDVGETVGAFVGGGELAYRAGCAVAGAATISAVDSVIPFVLVDGSDAGQRARWAARESGCRCRRARGSQLTTALTCRGNGDPADHAAHARLPTLGGLKTPPVGGHAHGPGGTGGQLICRISHRTGAYLSRC